MLHEAEQAQLRRLRLADHRRARTQPEREHNGAEGRADEAPRVQTVRGRGHMTSIRSWLVISGELSHRCRARRQVVAGECIGPKPVIATASTIVAPWRMPTPCGPRSLPPVLCNV